MQSDPGKIIFPRSKPTILAVFWKTVPETTASWWCFIEAWSSKKQYQLEVLASNTFQQLFPDLYDYWLHRFLFLMATPWDLPDALQSRVDRGSLRVPPSPTDVVALIKQYMGSENLSQPPLLVLTAGRADRVAMVPTQK